MPPRLVSSIIATPTLLRLQPVPENTKNIVGGRIPFLCLVKEGVALVSYGFAGSTAGNAFRTVCSSGRIEVR